MTVDDVLFLNINFCPRFVVKLSTNTIQCKNVWKKPWYKSGFSKSANVYSVKYTLCRVRLFVCVCAHVLMKEKIVSEWYKASTHIKTHNYLGHLTRNVPSKVKTKPTPLICSVICDVHEAEIRWCDLTVTVHYEQEKHICMHKLADTCRETIFLADMAFRKPSIHGNIQLPDTEKQF